MTILFPKQDMQTIDSCLLFFARFVLFKSVVLPVALLGASAVALADEGQWQPHQLPQLKSELKRIGITIPAERLADLSKHPMSAIVATPGCSASFVSPDGLVVTNHHCAYGAIQLNSTPEKNLMRDGFNAGTPAQEVSAGPNARIYALDTIQDVTKQVRAAIDLAPDALGRTQALEKIEKQLVASCEREPGFRCRLYSFSGGNSYRLFRNLEIKDVRLAYAPPGSVGTRNPEATFPALGCSTSAIGIRIRLPKHRPRATRSNRRNEPVEAAPITTTAAARIEGTLGRPR